MASAPTTTARHERASAVERADHGVRIDRAVLVGLALLSICLPLLVAWAGGALGIPRNDDFSYEGILFHWSRTGTLRFDNWPAMTLVGQLAIARPVVELLGARVTALQVLTTLVGAVGVCASYLLLCRVTVRRIAITAVLVTVLGPLWAPLAASFMTDVWAYTAIAVCLLVGCVALSSEGRRRLILLALSAAIGVVAVSIRESGLVAPIAVLGVAGWSLFRSSRSRWRRPTSSNWRRGDRIRLVLIVVVLVAAVGLVIGWRASISFGGQSSLKTVRETLAHPSRIHIWGSAIEPSLEALFTLGLLTLPATVLASVRRPLRRAVRARPSLAAAAAVVAVVAAVLAWRSGPVGNYVTQELGPSLSLGSPDDRLPNAAWAAIAALSAYSCFVIVLCAGSALVRLIGGHAGYEEHELAPRTPAHSVITTFTLLSVVLMFVGGPFDQPIYDRHLLPIVPFVAAFVMVEGALRPIARRRFMLAASSALGAFVVLGLVFSTSAAVYDGARWHAASDLVESGVDPLKIDGGLDWVGFHSGEPQRVHATTNAQDSWWASSYDNFRPCIVITSGHAQLGDQYKRGPFRKWVTTLPFGGDTTLRAYERVDCDEIETPRAR